jgi:hypothetical protein
MLEFLVQGIAELHRLGGLGRDAKKQKNGQQPEQRFHGVALSTGMKMSR